MTVVAAATTATKAATAKVTKAAAVKPAKAAAAKPAKAAAAKPAKAAAAKPAKAAAAKPAKAAAAKPAKAAALKKKDKECSATNPGRTHRWFTVVDTDLGTAGGRYKGSTPGQAASKAGRQLVLEGRKAAGGAKKAASPKAGRSATFSLRETTRECHHDKLRHYKTVVMKGPKRDVEISGKTISFGGTTYKTRSSAAATSE